MEPDSPVGHETVASDSEQEHATQPEDALITVVGVGVVAGMVDAPMHSHRHAPHACEMGANCASTFPSPPALSGLELRSVINLPGTSPSWALHAVPPTHPIPPPRV